MKNRNSTPNRYEYLTQTPVPKLISTLAVPTILSMLVTGIYNTADTFFGDPGDGLLLRTGFGNLSVPNARCRQEAGGK